MTPGGFPATIPHAAADAAAAWPDLPAVMERDETWSFSQLWARSRSAASALLASGVTAGSRVALWAPNSREWMVTALATWIVGAELVPINTRLKGVEAADILDRTKAEMLFTVTSFLGIDYKASLDGQHLTHLCETVFLNRDFSDFSARGSGIDDQAVDAAMAAIDADTVCDILFTSGTTGKPKGVLMTHGRVLPQCGEWIANAGLRRGDRYLLANPFFHSFGTKVGWVACLLTGATAIPMPQFDVEEAVRLIEAEGISFLPGPPTIFQMLLARKAERDFCTDSLRGGTTGAATVPPSLIAKIRDQLGIRDIITAYGMTECVNITGCRPGDPVEVIAGTCGRAIPGNEVVIASTSGKLAEPGEPGEILVRGTGVMLGYLDDPEATAAAIDGDGWLHTGDIGTMDANGYLTITDRLKDMFISGGFNVYPAEIERVLAGHPEVVQVAVIGVPDERLGEVGRAFVVPAQRSQLTEADLSAWARSRMANYKLPRQFTFLASLPLNAAGKVMKGDLREVA